MTTIRASDLLDRERNCFNVLRLMAAMAVIFSHSWTLRYGFGDRELGVGLSPFTVGSHAVNVFFVLSGFLIAESLSRSRSLFSYATARILRILPGLFVASLATAFVAGAILTNEPVTEYFTEVGTWTYPLLTTFGLNSNLGLPGFEAATMMPTRVNDPLWTLKYEAAAYAALVVLAGMGAFRRPVLLVLAILGSGALLAVAARYEEVAPWTTVSHVSRFSFAFLLGVAAWHWADRLHLRWDVAVFGLVVAFLAGRTHGSEPLWIVAFAYAALVLGSVRLGALSRFTARTDLSYGLYIYGWPIQQILFTALPHWPTPALAALSIAVTLVPAYASWVWVEEPALRLKSVLTGRTGPASAAG